MLEESDSVHSEAFRLLRTNLDFVNIERRAQVIMVTSALEAEGKSTTVANLAVALARAGRRIIVVDLDLRRPLLDKLFALGKRAGLTQVAIGQLPLEEALVPIVVSDGRAASAAAGLITNGKGGMNGVLEVLPAGPLPPDVGEFVGSRMLTELFEQLRHMADIILVDSPPLLRVGDAITLSGKVDGMIVVSNLAYARRPLLNELRRVLESCPADKLGFVVTGAHLEEGYGYGYGGYYYRTPERRQREMVAS
jgi:Mrp family chromosome partitioning ATPase